MLSDHENTISSSEWAAHWDAEIAEERPRLEAAEKALAQDPTNLALRAEVAVRRGNIESFEERKRRDTSILRPSHGNKPFSLLK